MQRLPRDLHDMILHHRQNRYRRGESKTGPDHHGGCGLPQGGGGHDQGADTAEDNKEHGGQNGDGSAGKGRIVHHPENAACRFRSMFMSHRP